MKRDEMRGNVRFAPGHNVITTAVSAALASLCGSAFAQPTLLYQWNFDGATPAAPAVSAGGGNLGITNSANGSVAFAGTGGVGGGGALDLSHNQQWGTLDPAGYASSATGSALTGLGSMSHITISMWVKANSAGNALTAGAIPRLFELADIPDYDRNNNNPPPQASQANNGLTMQLNGANKNFELFTRGQSNGTSVLGNPLPADQWTLVVWTIDTAQTGTNNNPYYDPDMQAVNGGQLQGNQQI